MTYSNDIISEYAGKYYSNNYLEVKAENENTKRNQPETNVDTNIEQICKLLKKEKLNINILNKNIMK